MPAIVVVKRRRPVRHATNHRGLDAAKIAAQLDWQVSDVNKYLGRSRVTISPAKARQARQEKLAALAALVQDVDELTEHNLRAMRAWFRMPLGALNGITPREEIVRGNLWRVRNLVDEMHSGLAF